MLHRRLQETTFFALGVILGAMGVVQVMGSPAGAVSCGTERLVAGFSGTNGRGVGASTPGIQIQNHSIDCAKMVAVGAENAAGTRQALVGWYEKASSAYLPGTARSPPRGTRGSSS